MTNATTTLSPFRDFYSRGIMSQRRANLAYFDWSISSRQLFFGGSKRVLGNLELFIKLRQFKTSDDFIGDSKARSGHFRIGFLTNNLDLSLKTSTTRSTILSNFIQ